MLTNEAKRRVVAGGMFALPIGLVWITGQILGGPAAVQAEPAPAVIPTPPVPVSDTADALPDGVREALERVAALEGEAFGPTPFLHTKRGTAAVIVVDDPEVAPPPTFTVKAILASSAGSRALIDGKAYSVGEAFGESGWEIFEIDPAARSVTLMEPDTERTVQGFVETPGLGRGRED